MKINGVKLVSFSPTGCACASTKRLKRDFVLMLHREIEVLLWPESTRRQ